MAWFAYVIWGACIASLLVVVALLVRFLRTGARDDQHGSVAVPSVKLAPPQGDEGRRRLKRLLSVPVGHGLSAEDARELFGGASIFTATEELSCGDVDPGLLAAVAERFNLSTDWLEGRDDRIYPILGFNNDLPGFARFLDGLIAEYGQVRLHALVPQGQDLSGDAYDAVVCLVVSVEIGQHSGKVVRRYYPINYEYELSYPPARQQFEALVLVAARRGVTMEGGELPVRLLARVVEGKIIPGVALAELGPRRWSPAELIFGSQEEATGGSGPEVARVVGYLKEKGWSVALPDEVKN